MKNQIKACRTARRFTQQDVADALNITRSAVAMWESRGQGMTIQTLCRLADLLEVSTDVLLGREAFGDRIEVNNEPLSEREEEESERKGLIVDDLIDRIETEVFEFHFCLSPNLKPYMIVNTKNDEAMRDLRMTCGNLPVTYIKPFMERNGRKCIVVAIDGNVEIQAVHDDFERKRRP